MLKGTVIDRWLGIAVVMGWFEDSLKPFTLMSSLFKDFDEGTKVLIRVAFVHEQVIVESVELDKE